MEEVGTHKELYLESRAVLYDVMRPNAKTALPEKNFGKSSVYRAKLHFFHYGFFKIF